MQKNLWLYPLIAGLMIAAILCCMLRIGWAISRLQNNHAFTGAYLVQEVTGHAAI